MKVLITGGGGFLGQKLGHALARANNLNGQGISSLVLADLTQPDEINAPFKVERIAADLSNSETVNQLFAPNPDVTFHLAALASGGSEADLDLGLSINLYGMINLLEAARASGQRSGKPPIIVYSSSCAVHGGEAPEIITDNVELNPQTSYGSQKAMGELMLNDFSRRGLIDGRGLRLPTVSIRPGKPNTAASSFMSSIFREPLQGETANCPVNRDHPIWHTAPRTVIHNIIHAAGIPAADWGMNRNITLSGRTDTIAEMIDAMTRVAGPDPAKRITWNHDATVEKIVAVWRMHYQTDKALRLGFKADASFEDSVRWFMEDDIA